MQAAYQQTDLTPLQQAAVERIRDYEKELKGYGLYARTSIELEFNVENEKGEPTPGAIRIPIAEQFLKHALPYIQELELECGRVPHEHTANKAQYEVKIAEMPRRSQRPDPTGFSPLTIAGVTGQLKARTLADMLKESTCLTPALMKKAPGTTQLQPNFTARPYGHLLMSPQNQPYRESTSGMHINISLYNEQGENLFTRNPCPQVHPDAPRSPLVYQCAQSLLSIQNEAGLSMVPHENSPRRLLGYPETTNSVPKGIGATSGKQGEDPYTSILQRDISENRKARLENRLPGADADPYVTMAVTLAAMVDAVRNHVHEIAAGESVDPSLRLFSGSRYRVDPLSNDDLARYELPKEHAGFVEKLKQSHRMRELFGDALYNGILKEYGGKTASLTP
jgi:hypothetical protein